MAVDVDTSQLAKYCSFPQSSLDLLLDNPTKELVRTLLQTISVRAEEYEEAKAGSLRLNVELENAVRGGEAKTRVLRASVDKGLREAAELRQRLQTEETARLALESEHKALKVSTSSSTEEKAILQARITSLESSHRDTVSLLESKSTAYDSLTNDLSVERQKIVELRQQLSASEQNIQSANSSASNAKYREQALEQEVEQLKRSNEWYNNELKEKSEEHSKLRKDKNSRISELQRNNEELSNTLDSLRRTETTLRSRLEDLEHKADESFLRIQNLQEEAARKDEEFQVELSSANRLAELMKSSAETEKRRQQEILEELEETKENASEEIGRIIAENETEHRDREAAERHIVELEARKEELETEVQKLRDQVHQENVSSHAPNGFMTPNRRTPLSRMGSPTPGKARGATTMTQMVSDYNEMKSELEAERRRSQKLSQTVDEMMSDLESRQPEVAELREDHARLQADVNEMTSLIDSIGKERDEALKDARKQSSMINAKIREGELLRQQLRDLSSQVKVLLMEIHLRDRGDGELSEQTRVQLERLAQDQLDDGNLDNSTATDRFISQNLVTFRNISELEEQNSKLVTLTRELGQRMEEEERAKQGAAEAAREQEQLQEKYERCKDEIKSLITQSQSYIKERDMFRRMLSHRGQIAPGTDLESVFGKSVNGGGPTTPARRELASSVDQSPNAKDLADYAKLLKDMQNHFDAYRQESATDRSTLKDQVDSLSRTNGQLRGEVTKSNSQVELANERYEMVQANYKLLKSENSELQKRSQFYAENAAKMDIRAQQAAEELVEAKGLMDSMRNESANLRAEKEFWKTIEKRLTDDNRALQEEQSRLNALNTDLQRILNEREFSDSESRRRLQVQIDKLEQDLQILQKQLGVEVEEKKQLLLRQGFETQQSQKRIDDLVTSLGSTREALASTKATRDQLESRVQELTVELRSAEERFEVLRSASTHRQPNESNEAPLQTNEVDADTLGREQTLALEISELKRDLELSQNELRNAKSQIEQYKAISQSSEEELASLNETLELYRQDTDKRLAELNTKTEQLEERLSDTTSELSSSNAELAKLRGAEAEVWRQLDEQKAAHEAEIANLRDVADRHEAAAQFHQADLRSQTQITQQAQSNYENELMKHGETAKSLRDLRNEVNQLKVQTLETRGELENTRASLAQNEENWTEAKDRYERELADVRTGRENLQVQNSRLHQQLESVTAQISSLQKRAPIGEEGDSMSETPASSLDNLQEVIKYLRREKEIVDVQLEISSQECKRVKQQLQYTQSQLDEVRLRLNQQRRVEEESERTVLNHNKLMETINELSTFRESNVTLRNESRQTQAALATKTTELEELQAQMEPLRSELREIKGDLENAIEESRLITEDRDRWQQRAQTILQKYDRIDPAELEALKEKIQVLEKEKKESDSTASTLQARIQEAEKQAAAAQEQSAEKLTDLRQKLGEQFKARSRELTGKIRDKDSQIQAAAEEKGTLEGQITTLQNELETARTERDQAAEKTAHSSGPTADGNESEEGQVMERETSAGVPKSNGTVLQTQLDEAYSKMNNAIDRSEELQAQVQNLQTGITELESQLGEKQRVIDSSTAEMDQLRERAAQSSAEPSTFPLYEEQLQRLRQQLLEAQRQNENLRATLAISATPADEPTAEGSRTMSDIVSENADEIRSELDKRHIQRMAELEEEFKRRTDGMRAQLSRKLTEGKAEARKAIKEESDKALEDLKATHEQEIQSLNTRHQSELDELRRHLEERFETYKAEWQTSHPSDKTLDAPQAAPSRDSGQDASLPELSDAQAKSLVAKNETIKEIVRRNITTGIIKNKEANAAQVKQECEQEYARKLSEAQQKANKEKEQAIAMETKRNTLKISMSENQKRTAMAKIEIVQTAAKDTPQRPVGEVWAVAKDAKAAPVQPAPAPKAATAATSQNGTSVNPGATPTPTQPGNAQPAATATPMKSEGTSNSQPSTEPVKSPALNPSAQAFSPAQQQQPAVSEGSTAPQQQIKPPDGAQAQQRPAAPQGQQGQANGIPRLAQPASSNAQPRPQGQQMPGAGQAVVRGLQQSGIPMARASIRGGRGRGQGRAAPQNIDTTRTQGQSQQGQGRGSPSSARAKQFVPGNKRPREDGGEGGQGGDGKRIRGGAGGGN